MSSGYRNIFGSDRIQTPLFYATSGVKNIVNDMFFGELEISWFICGYKTGPGRLGANSCRTCMMDDYTAQIRADGGKWSETEVLGNFALVKAKAYKPTMLAIGNDPRFTRIPLTMLNDLLLNLPTELRQHLKDLLLAMGYTIGEIVDALGGDISVITLGQFLRFATTRRLKPRYDHDQDLIILDGPVQPCVSVDKIDAEVA